MFSIRNINRYENSQFITKMRAIVIDAWDNDVREITLVEEANTLEQMYEIIGCDTVEVVHLPNGDDLWVDEEGLLYLSPHSRFFTYNGTMPIHGRGIILGLDRKTGECKSTKLKIEDVTDSVDFYSLYEVRELAKTEY
jgi:hypothetical protein